MNRSFRASRFAGRAATALPILLATAPVAGVTHLRYGEKPPALSALNTEGAPFSLADVEGRPAVLLFGELYHARSLEAARLVQTLLGDPRLAGARPWGGLIVAQQADASTLGEMARRLGVTLDILHDHTRQTYDSFRVSVLPSVVVLDRAGLVVTATAGMPPSLRDVLSDAALLAAGKIDKAEFDRRLSPTSRPAESESARRAARLASLGDQLVRAGMAELAVDKYREALEIEPRFGPALLGWGRLCLQQGRLVDAEERFRKALSADASSAKAVLGLAQVQARRGGRELEEAERQVRALLVRRPADPEAHYLLGCILEQSDRVKEAAASYRQAAELLLARGPGD